MKLLIALLVGIALIATVRMVSTDNQGNSSIEDQIAYLPKASSVKLLAMGHTNALSSLYWISAIVGLGESYLTGVRFKWFNQVANLVSTMDPDWKIVYEFIGGIADTADAAVDSVMLRGIKNFPEDWRLSTYYAMYVVNENQDYVLASKIMQPFENRTDIPEHITKLSKSFAVHTMPRESAISVSLEDYFNPRNHQFKKGIAKRILKILGHSTEEKDIQQMMQLLERASSGKISPENLYFTLMGTLPF